MSEENILQAHSRIYGKLIFIISCYDIDYAYDYAHNLNNKTFKNFFKVIKTNDIKIINDAYDESKQIIYITQLPLPDMYSFNFINDIFHIHLAVPFWNKYNKIPEKELEILKQQYNDYLNNIQKITIHKFVNIKDNRKLYDNNAEDKLYNIMIELIEKHLNNKNKFKRMNYTGGKIIIYGDRNLNE
jgi:CHAT domain-containing protein